MLTKKNHYNPCFWSALWNNDYFTKFQIGKQSNARDQRLFCLHLKSGKILYGKVSGFHYVLNGGILKLNENNAHLLKQIQSPVSKAVALFVEKYSIETVIDFEHIYNALEDASGYDSMLEVVKTNKIDTNLASGLAGFIHAQMIRHPKMTDLIISKNPGADKFFAYIKIIQQLINPRIRFQNLILLARHPWILYSLTGSKFPLSDTPFIETEDILWITLSPYHLLEINKKVDKFVIKYRTEISTKKYAEVKIALIKNCSDSLLHSDEKFLENWKKIKTWLNRRSKVISRKLPI